VATVAWDIDLLRFSAFPPPSVAFAISPLWERVVGQAPAEVQERPQQGLRNEIGPFGQDTLVITQTLVRFDIIFGMSAEKAASLKDLISLGPYEEREKPFSTVVRKWLEIAPTVGRIAFAPNLIHGVSTQQEGYELLKQILPALPIDAKNSRDLFWQINRPRTSKVLKEVTINRLAKWQMLRREQIQVIPERGGMYTGGGQATYALKLDLDIYTEPFTPIPSESLQSLYSELVTAADELMKAGDVP
jgi:hypothetical protein